MNSNHGWGPAARRLNLSMLYMYEKKDRLAPSKKTNRVDRSFLLRPRTNSCTAPRSKARRGR